MYLCLNNLFKHATFSDKKRSLRERGEKQAMKKLSLLKTGCQNRLTEVAVVWCGVVWCGVVWCGVVWLGVEVGPECRYILK